MNWYSWVSISLLLSTTTTHCTCEVASHAWWLETGRALRFAVKDCWSKATKASVESHTIAVLMNCLHYRARVALRRALSADVITVTDGVELVRYQERNATTTLRISRMDNGKMNKSLANWSSLMMDALTDIFETHAIRISVRNIYETDINEARRRRKNQFFPLMMFGVFGLGMILIPMGFKFLAVLGGKALLLAKMALILSSIQGLKKVATSGIGYGLYHTSAGNPWYDRKAEDIETPYRMEETYYSQYPEQVIEYKRYPHA